MSSLPSTRGPLSEFVVEALGDEARELPPGPAPPCEALADDDLQLALYCCYELHYRSFDGVDERWEWEPSLIAFRGSLERAFEAELLELVPHRGTADGRDMDRRLRELIATDDGPQLSRQLETRASSLLQPVGAAA